MNEKISIVKSETIDITPEEYLDNIKSYYPAPSPKFNINDTVRYNSWGKNPRLVKYDEKDTSYGLIRAIRWDGRDWEYEIHSSFTIPIKEIIQSRIHEYAILELV